MTRMIEGFLHLVGERSSFIKPARIEDLLRIGDSQLTSRQIRLYLGKLSFVLERQGFSETLLFVFDDQLAILLNFLSLCILPFDLKLARSEPDVHVTIDNSRQRKDCSLSGSCTLTVPDS